MMHSHIKYHGLSIYLFVLILVVMDDALALCPMISYITRMSVLILVVMDDALAHTSL